MAAILLDVDGVLHVSDEPISGAAVQPVGNVSAPTYEQLRSQLLAQGATLISMTTNVETGETKLICQVPKAGSPSVRQTYEAKARDEVSAMRAVLDRISAGR